MPQQSDILQQLARAVAKELAMREAIEQMRPLEQQPGPVLRFQAARRINDCDLEDCVFAERHAVHRR